MRLRGTPSSAQRPGDRPPSLSLRAKTLLPRLRGGPIDQRWLWSVPVLAVYFLTVVLPILRPFASLLTAGVATTPVWEPEIHPPLMANSLRLATTVTAATLILALPLALLLYRTDLPLPSLWIGALLVPLLIPPYILGVGVLHVLTPQLAVGFVGSVVTLTLWLLPLALLFAGAGLRLVSRTHEEAALLETTRWRVFLSVTLPMAWAHVLAGGLCVFVLALGEFGVPVLFQYRVYPGAIFAQFAAFYDFRRAVVTTLPLLVIIVGIVLAAQALWGGTNREGTGNPPARFPLGTATLPSTLAAGLIALAVLLPFLRIVGGVGSGSALLGAFHRVWEQATETFALALVGALTVVVQALLVAWVLVRLRLPGNRWLLGAQIPMFGVPAVLTGLGLIGLWNEPDWRSAVYRSPVILVLGYAARFTPFLIPLLAASYEQVPEELDEAAQLDGACPLDVLARIHVPLLRPILVSAVLLAFVLCVGEVPISMLVAPPGHAPLAVRFFTLITNAPAEQVAALSLVTALLALLPVAAWLIVDRSREERPVQQENERAERV